MTTACHAVATNLPGQVDADVVRRRLADVVAALSLTASTTVHVEPVPAAAGEDVARQLRLRTLNRPVGAGRSPLRVVVLEYADGERDVVVVCPWALLDRAALSGVVAYLAHGARLDDVVGAGSRTLAALTSSGQAGPPWGVPVATRTGAVVLPVDTTGVNNTTATTGGGVAPTTATTVAAVVTATAIALARYDVAQEVTFLLVQHLVGDDGRLVETVRHARVVAPGEAGCEVHDQDRDQEAASVERPVAVVVTEHRGGETYLPFLTPPSPFTIAWDLFDDGRLRGTVHTDASRVHPAVAKQFADLVGRALVAGTRPTSDGPASDGPASDGPTSDGPTSAAEVPSVDEASAAAMSALTPLALRRPLPPSVVAAFQRVAHQRGAAIAVQDDTRRLSYAALAEEAAALADALRGLGVRPGDRVGLCLGRGADSVVSMLAVLGCAATYVPMDPGYPDERLAFTAADAGLSVVISDRADFPAGPTTVLSPAELRSVPVTERVGLVETAPPGPGYVIYTSGSTGRPKGVEVPQANVLNLVAATREDLALGPADTWTLFHSTAFDFSVWEVWGCLLTGGRLVVVPYWVSRSPEEFHALLVLERVSVLNQTPSAFAALSQADAQAPGRLALRLLIFGGEPLDVELLRPWFERYPHPRCRVVNMYGITETTVHVTTRTVTSADVAARSRSVGVALPGWGVSVRDEAGRVQPYGVPGEIWVQGAGVADGYLARPDLTAQRFVVDPVTGRRSYRSGDLGRLRPDGSLDHLGRIDNQVKIRGFRIELDEIRAVLLRHPAVRSAAVIVGTGAVGGALPDGASLRLDAFVTGPDPATAQQLRDWCARSLPDYMVPAGVYVLEQMPMTVNGKVDLARLTVPRATSREIDLRAGDEPPPAAAAADSDAGYAPQGPDGLLGVVLRVWGEVLGRDVDATDDFFACGGNSLLAVRLSGALRRAGLPPVALRELYLNPNPASLTRVAAERMEGAAS